MQEAQVLHSSIPGEQNLVTIDAVFRSIFSIVIVHPIKVIDIEIVPER